MFVEQIGKSLAAVAKAGIVAALPGLTQDLIGLAAVASITWGCWLAWKPAGFIVGGAIVLAGIVFINRGHGAAGLSE